MVFATAKNLHEAIEKGEFREDLYYRINIVPVTLPPLNERGDDIELLVAHFLQKIGAEHGRNLHLSDEARTAFYSYPYPGNVRELRNTVERAVLLASGETIHVAELPERMQAYADTKKHSAPSASQPHAGTFRL
ncbi:sigma 54-interacting transcriptional regulator [Oleidesulfovibrio sp.]|uniref:sigma 54-interacting transcriptional regulator n=1 Tax=Oleidesulfovibrio sp. TaxID=2909707 RepID=UPI003A87BE04